MIKDAFLELCIQDREFIESTEKGTYGTTEVKLRTEKWFNRLRDTIGSPKIPRDSTHSMIKNTYMTKPMEFVNYAMRKYNTLKMHK